MDETIKKKLKEIVGEENYTDQLIDLISYSRDASQHKERPFAAVWPTDAEQVSKILILANEQNFAVTPRGAGTSLSGSAVPAHGGVVLDLAKMNKIVDIRIADRLAVVQPGVVYADLDKALAPSGFCFPPDPASGKVCTIGGNVSTNAGGVKGAKYGVTRDYVMGLEVVLPDGRITRTGSYCMKSSSGYDLTRIFVGAEGTLGIITEITLKINPKPLVTSTGMATFAELKNAGRAVTDIMHSGVIPSVLEVMDENTIRVLRQYADFDLPDVMAIILVETDGYTKEEAAFQMSKIEAIFTDNQATDIKMAQSRKKPKNCGRSERTSVASPHRYAPTAWPRT